MIMIIQPSAVRIVKDPDMNALGKTTASRPYVRAATIVAMI